jgi:hypothetical protein
MNRYIPEQSAWGFLGDNRSSQGNGGTFKSQQMFDGNGLATCAAGMSSLSFWPSMQQQGSVGVCNGYQTPLGGRKDGRQIFLDTTATNGLIPFAPPIQTTVTINEGPNGATGVNVWGTPFPSLEIWQYGGPNGPQLIYDYRAQGSPASLYSPRRLP